MEAALASDELSSAEPTRLRILRAAETIFADAGYDGASMRLIAQEADVAQGLLHYHFSTKERLFGEVVAWRTEAINGTRHERLEALGASPELEEILQALFEPSMGTNAGGAAYARIMVALATGGGREQTLVSQHYDATAERFIDAIMEATGFDRAQAAWGYSLSIHVLMAAMSRTGRTERLAGEKKPASHEKFLTQITRFAAAGVRALQDDPKQI
jgi:AcrR family transcriptional regulator